MIPLAAVDLPDGNPVLPMSGPYFFNLNLKEFGLILPFQMEVESIASSPVGTIQTFGLRAYSEEMLSDVFATASDVEITAEGTFEAKFPKAVLPAAFSPSGSDVELDLTLKGVIQSETEFCGAVTGQLVTLGTELVASTFAAVPWSELSDDAPSSCSPVQSGSACERLAADACPDFASGENSFQSCGLERKVRIHLPKNHDPTKSYKTVILFHGFNVDPDDIEEDTAMNRFVDDEDFILLEPYSQPFGVEWDQLSWRDNADVALFDDLATCAQAKLGGDPERLYAAGDSGGGLFTTYLTMRRSELIAASAINSGGLFIDLPSEVKRQVPVIFGWGGTCDIARDQSFETFAFDIFPKFRTNGNFFVKCNHDSGHEWKPKFTPWMLEFLFSHTLSQSESHSPRVVRCFS